MKFYSHRLIAAFVAFIIGTCAVWLYWQKSEKQDLKVISTIESQVKNPSEILQQPEFEQNPEPLKPINIKDLRPSSDYWDKDTKNVPVQISRLSQNRKLAAVGDTLYMLDEKNQLVWTWTTGGAPLTDFPIMDSRGILYVIGCDLTFVALDSKNGEILWQGTACGRATYSQIELYKDDMYFVVTDMTGYRENNPSNFLQKDILTLYKGNRRLWDTEIPVGAEIKIRKGEVFAVLKQKRRTLVQKIKIPNHFEKFLGTIN